MPSSGYHTKLKSRPRGLPDIGYQLESEDEDATVDGLERVTYRLPKLSPRLMPGDEDDDERDKKVWSRYGYEEPSGSEISNSPQPGIRGHPAYYGPKFESAMIAPVGYRPPTHIYKPSFKTWDQSLYRRYARVADITPAPVSTPLRPCSPIGSVKSIHWTLGLHNNNTFDRKGKTRVQGPFSREFTVTCMAPSNWLRMKWGPRSRTIIF